MPEIPLRDATVTAGCAVCGGPLPAGRRRTYCGPTCRQRAYRIRHEPDPRGPASSGRPQPPAGSRTATGVYECDDCGERLVGERRCQSCNRYTRRAGTGGSCPACGEPITIEELLEAPTT